MPASIKAIMLSCGVDSAESPLHCQGEARVRLLKAANEGRALWNMVNPRGHNYGIRPESVPSRAQIMAYVAAAKSLHQTKPDPPDWYSR